MLCTYEQYLNLFDVITIDECIKLHHDMVEEIGDDEDALEMYEFMLAKAIDYAVLRSQWTIKDRTWKLNEDPRRTAKHDALIDQFNILARYLKGIGKATDWRDALGYVEDDPSNRKRIGDFGCYLVFVHALNGR